MEEEPEIQEPTIEEQLNTETSKPTKLNKNGKPRKQLSQDALERLAKAREKANAIRKQQTVKKLEEKVEKLNTETKNILPPKEEQKPEGVADELSEENVEIVKEKPKPKPKGKKKTKIIVEQSSEDSDEFEPNDNVVFVKRVSRKKKEPVLERQPAMDSTSGMGILPPPDEPPKPPRPELTPQQRVLKSQYENMFSGGFMNQSNLMRRHY